VAFALVITCLKAEANICAADAVPAATLLFPHVVFDYSDPLGGVTTLIIITNMSHQAQIVHVTLWSDYGEHVLGFNIVLAGYDMESFNLRDILLFGLLPKTGTAGDLVVTPNRDPRAEGPVQPDAAPWAALTPAGGSESIVDRCPPDAAFYPDYPPIPQNILEFLQEFLQVSQTDDRLHEFCDGSQGSLIPDDWFQARTGEDPTHLYITANVVSRCDRVRPDLASYWEDPEDGGLALDANVLTGEVIWSGRDAYGREMAIADRAVHIEADEELAAVTRQDDEGLPVSFYYRWSSLQGSPSDLREPLPTAWALRYMGWKLDGLDTNLRVWKGSTFHWRSSDLTYDRMDHRLIARDCMTYTYYSWDEDGQVTWSHSWPPWGPDPWETANLLPLVTQEVSIDQFNMVDTHGWVLFVWPPSNWAGADVPEPDIIQTWMSVRYAAGSTASAGLDAVVAGNAACFPDQVLPGLGVDYDYVDEEGYRTGETP
jgi:hypothetical protein